MATFCRTAVTPLAADDGITGHNLTSDSIGCPISTNPDLTLDESSALDNEGRAVMTEHLGVGGVRVVIINVYCPRVDPDSPDRLPYKLRFLAAIRERCNALIEAGKLVQFSCCMCTGIHCTFFP